MSARGGACLPDTPVKTLACYNYVVDGKKGCQINANLPLAESTDYILDRFEDVLGRGRGGGPRTVRSKLNKFEHVRVDP